MTRTERINKKVTYNFFGPIKHFYEGSVTYNGPVYESEEHQDVKATSAAAYTDEVVDRAIAALNGKGKPLCEKQLFLGVIKVLSSKCGWSSKWATSCERINLLPTAGDWEVSCDANNLKAPSALKFASLDYAEWEDYEPKEGEREVFRKNKELARTFEEELDKQLLTS